MILSLYENRFDGFAEETTDQFKDELEAEFRRRHYEVYWHANRTAISWARPEGFMSRQEVLTVMGKQQDALTAILRRAPVSWKPRPDPEQLHEALMFLRSEISRIEYEPDGDYSQHAATIEVRLSEILD